MPSSLAHGLGSCTLLSVATLAQCSNAWSVDVSLPGPGRVYDSILWDPDGPGPLAGRLVVGGAFQATGPGAVHGVAAFDDTTGVWQPIGTWTFGQVLALAGGSSGELFASGFDTTLPHTFRMMHWNGVAWSQLGGNFDVGPMAATVLANGDLIVGGLFSTVGAVAAAGVARWDGSSWHPMGNGPGYYCDELLVMPNGDLVAGGIFGVARWDGVAWHQLGSAPGYGLALAVMQNGDLVAGLYPNTVVRWDGTRWIQLGGAVLPIPAAYIEALAVLPNGDLVAAEGTLILGGTLPRLARWDGAAWTPIGTTDGAVRTLTVRPGPNFDMVVGGDYMTVNGLATIHVARLTTTCPAAVTSMANGCVGGGLSLAAEPAWVGGTWSATAMGLPQPAFVVGAYGVVPAAAQLSSLIGQAMAGCMLHMQPVVCELLPAANGVASSRWTLPNTVAIAGARFRHQMVALHYAPGFTIVSALATDAAELTVGAF